MAANPHGGPGPIRILANVNPNLMQSQALAAQSRLTRDPLQRSNLDFRSALEAKYAQGAANAQNVVQQAAQKDWSPIHKTSQQMMANYQRQDIERRAAQEYNNELRKRQMLAGQLWNPATEKTLTRWDL